VDAEPVDAEDSAPTLTAPSAAKKSDNDEDE